MSFIQDLKDEAASEAFAKELAQHMAPGMIMGLKGSIGMGKTFLIRAILRTLGVTAAVKSPSFNLVEIYHLKDFYIYHFDLYRLSSDTDLEDIGFRDYLRPDAICCIEWPENAPSLAGLMDLMIEFSLDKRQSGRQLNVRGLTMKGKQCIERLAKK